MRKSSIGLIIVSLVVCLFIGTGKVIAEPSTGEEILQKVDQVFAGAESRELEVKMTIINEQGQEREQRIQLLSKGEAFGLVKFLAPLDVEGTSFLIRKAGEELEMWLYLPALGNARKISSQMKQGNFMGTDFSYSDLTLLDGSKYRDQYSSELVEISSYDEQPCYLLSLTPGDEGIGYSKIHMWVQQADYLPVKLEFYDLEGKRVKVMTSTQIREVSGYLTPYQIIMENVQRGTKTILKMEKVKYDLELPEYIFTPRYLERG